MPDGEEPVTEPTLESLQADDDRRLPAQEEYFILWMSCFGAHMAALFVALDELLPYVPATNQDFTPYLARARNHAEAIDKAFRFRLAFLRRLNEIKRVHGDQGVMDLQVAGVGEDGAVDGDVVAKDAFGSDELGQRTLDLLSSSLSARTLKSYAGRLSQFAEFCHDSENISPLEATTATVVRKHGRPQIALPPAKAPTLDPEGAQDGPKRTPISFADAYNGREAYKVEKILAQLKLLIRSPCAAPVAAANRRATVQPRKSIVWNYFSKKFRGEDGYLYSTCSLCRTTMSFCNTTNLINHLIRKHSDDLVDDAMGGKIALKAIFKKDAGGFNKHAPVAEAVKLTKLPDDVKRDYDAAVVKWIVKSCMPHSITERDQYLQEFLKEEIQDLQKEPLSVSLAADIWGENGISIVAIMAYWITPDFRAKGEAAPCQAIQSECRPGP
eukprot:jgi/Tetstr1/425922/TSEL_001597.t2